MHYSTCFKIKLWFLVLFFGENLYMEGVDVRLVMKHGITVKLSQKQTNASDCQSLTVNLVLSARQF